MYDGSRVKNGSLRLLFISNGVFVLAGNLLGPLFAVYLERFTKSPLVISLTWATFWITTTLLTWIIAKVGDRLNKGNLLAAGFIIRAIAWLAFAFVGNLTAVILLQVLLGLGEALGSPAFDAIFAEHLDKNRHVEDYADWKVINNLATAAGTIVGGFIVTSFGFSPLFLMMSGMAMASFVIVRKWVCPNLNRTEQGDI